MGKRIIIISFLLSLSLALWKFLSRDESSLLENIEKAPSHQKPRVILEDFVVRKYKGGSLESEFSANYADFEAPNKVKMIGDIKGWQWRGDKKQSVKAGYIVSYFNSSHLTELMNKGEIESADLSKLIEFSFQDHILYSDSAHFDAIANKISSQDSVRVEGPKRWFIGNNGFRLYLNEETLDVYGKIRGMVYPSKDH